MFAAYLQAAEAIILPVPTCLTCEIEKWPAFLTLLRVAQLEPGIFTSVGDPCGQWLSHHVATEKAPCNMN